MGLILIEVVLLGFIDHSTLISAVFFLCLWTFESSSLFLNWSMRPGLYISIGGTIMNEVKALVLLLEYGYGRLKV